MGNGILNEDRPDIIGDQIAWCVYNDAVTPRTRFVGVPPLGIEIHQTVFGYKTNNAPQLKNVLFIRYKIINKGTVNSILDSVYFSAWTDPDLGEIHWDDLAGCDTLSSFRHYFTIRDQIRLFDCESLRHLFMNLLQKPHSIHSRGNFY